MAMQHSLKTLLSGSKGTGSAAPSRKPVAEVPGGCDRRLIHRLLEVIEQDIIPLTREAVSKGNKIFGAGILKKSDLSLVIAAANNEIETLCGTAKCMP